MSMHMALRAALFLVAASFVGCGGGGGGGTDSFSETSVLAAPPAGDLDSTFGVDGVVITSFGSAACEADAVALQQDGKIVVAGSAFDGSRRYGNFAVARFNTDGTLDSSFGSQGKVVTDIAGGHDEAFSVAVQSDGKILVAGDAVIDGWESPAIVRYTTDGSLDPSFDGDGKVIGRPRDRVCSLVLQEDGKLVFSGFTHVGPWRSDILVARFYPDGSPDSTFGSSGRVTTQVGDSSYGSAAAIQTDGKIVVGGHCHNGGSEDFTIVRYAQDGSLDPGFGTLGIQITDIAGDFDWAGSLALQPDGMMVLAGETSTTDRGYLFACVRYTQTGVLDTNFGDGGIVLTDIGSGADQGSRVCIQADGKLILAGLAGIVEEYFNAAVMARYNPDGSLDMSFGNGGSVILDVRLGNDHWQAVAIGADGKIVAVGTTFEFTPADHEPDFLIGQYCP